MGVKREIDVVTVEVSDNYTITVAQIEPTVNYTLHEALVLVTALTGAVAELSAIAAEVGDR